MKFTESLIALGVVPTEPVTETESSMSPDASSVDMGFLVPIVLPIIGLLVAWIVVGYLWNNKYRPLRLKKDVPTATFNHILKRTFRFLFKEDKVQSPKIKNPFVAKIFVWRNFYFACMIAIAALIALKMSPLIPLVALFLVAFTRTSSVFRKRHVILMRMFDVASVGLGYPRDAPANPWSWVNIKKWEDMTTPGDTVIRFPAKFKSGEMKNREAFENHFSTTVTDGNSWIFTWKSAESAVLLAPVTHIPERVEYNGSAHAEWDKIPIGIGSSGEVVWDLQSSPHSLITGTTGAGKRLFVKTSVLTSNGWSTIGDLKVGDTIFDANGNTTQVTHLHPIITPAKAYEITFRNGEKIIVDPDHLWETETRIARVSRFDNVKNEIDRSRVHWLDENIVNRLKAELAKTSSTDTISIPEMASLVEKSAETKTFYTIAKVIGPAEEVRPKVKFHYNAQIVKQKQKVTYVDSAEFMELYNSRRITTRKTMPISQNQYDKLGDLKNELRDSDSMTTDAINEYINAGQITARWVKANFDAIMPLKDAIADLYLKAEKVRDVFPDKIFSINKDEINAREFSTLIDVELNSKVSSMFANLAVKASSKSVRKEIVELVVPEKTIERLGNPYVTYPKQLFIERLLEWNATPINDQRHNREISSVKTTQELFDTLWSDEKKTHRNHSIKKTPAVEFAYQELPIAPYSLGAWLGDGSSHTGSICGIDHQVFEKVVTDGYPMGRSYSRERGHEDFRSFNFPLLQRKLKENGLLAHYTHKVRIDGSPKHIPAKYFVSSIEQRRELLRGLLDTDGTVDPKGVVQFATSIPQLRDDVKRLVASLGYIPFVTQKEPSYTHNGEKKKGKTAYTISFYANPEDRLFHIDRKNIVHAERFYANGGNSLIENHYIVDIQEVEPVPMRCISVDSPSRLFAVSDSMIPTHNSVLQRNLIFHCIQHPDRWRFLGIDVKMVELTPYLKYEPVVMGIATNVEDGVEIIRYANEEMQNRYKMMTEKGVANFRDLPDMPHALMVMIDESYAFLATTGNKTDAGKEKDALKGEASAAIGDIARLGRAAGVHLVMATQRPDATVIYGELKQNLSARFSAGRADSIASQMTLDNDQATRLPAIKGRGYFQTNGQGEQFQGYYADQSWIDNWLISQESGGDENYPEINLEKEPVSKKKDKAPKKAGLLGKMKKDKGGEKGKKNKEELADAPFVDEDDDFIDPLDQIPGESMSNKELSELANEFNNADDEDYGSFDGSPSINLHKEEVTPVPTVETSNNVLPEMGPDLDSIFDDLDEDNESYGSMFTSSSDGKIPDSMHEDNPFGELDDDFMDVIQPKTVSPVTQNPAKKKPVKATKPAPVEVMPDDDFLDPFAMPDEIIPIAPVAKKAPTKPVASQGKTSQTKASGGIPTKVEVAKLPTAPKPPSMPVRPNLPSRPTRPQL